MGAATTAGGERGRLRDGPDSGAASQTRASDFHKLFFTLLAPTALIVVAHRVLLPATLWASILPAEAYMRGSLVLGALSYTPFVILSLVALAPLALRRRHIGWSDIDAAKRTRLFMMVPVLIFAWVCSLYDFNLYFGQIHLDGRLLVVLIALACWLHPAFVGLLAIWAAVILSQIQVPIVEGAWHWADKRLPFDTLILFTAFLHVRAWLKPHRQLLPFLILVLTGATYAYAAYRKMMLGPTPLYWPLNNEFGNLFVGAYLNGGWLAQLTVDRVLEIASTLNSVSPLLGFLTISVEAAGIALLWHRRATAPILCAIIGMHVMILLSSGIFFWKWMLYNAALIAYVAALNRDSRSSPDAKRHRALALLPARFAIPAAVLLVLGARETFMTLRFAWHDSPVTNYFEMRAEGVSGQDYRLDPRFLGPYELIVQQSRFYYLMPRPVLAGTFASMYDRALLEALENASVEDFPELHQRYGLVYQDSAATARFVDFIRRSMHNARQRGHRDHALSALAAPYHFRGTPGADTYDFQEPIVAVTLRWQEWFYDGVQLHHVTDEPILRVPID